MEHQQPIRKLDETNFFTWAFEIEMVLRSKNLFDHCLVTKEEFFPKIKLGDESTGDVGKWDSDDSKEK